MSYTRPFLFRRQLTAGHRVLYAGGTFVLVLLLWCTLSYGHFVDSQFLASPSATVRALWTSLSSGELLSNALISIARILVAFAVAGTAGILVGTVAGTFPQVEASLIPLNSALRYIPPTAFIGLTIIWFGIGELNKFAFIFLAIIFYVIQMSVDTVKLVPRVYVEAAQMLGAKRSEIFRKVVLGFSFPNLLAVLRINLGAAWTFLVVAELIAAQSGLGYLMAMSQRFLLTPKLYAVIIFVGLLGYASDALMGILIHRVSRWR
jgi:NitT/TauT family transport system permease protein